MVNMSMPQEQPEEIFKGDLKDNPRFNPNNDSFSYCEDDLPE